MVERQILYDINFPTYKHWVERKYNDGTNLNLQEVLINKIKENTKLAKRLCNYFRRPTVYETCLNLYNFCQNNFIYKQDKFSQNAISIPAMLKIGVGDCKYYSTFICGILTALGIKNGLELASYHNDKIITHIYNFAFDEKNNIIYIDAITNKFNWKNQNTTFIKQIIFNDMQINSIHGNQEGMYGNQEGMYGHSLYANKYGNQSGMYGDQSGMYGNQEGMYGNQEGMYGEKDKLKNAGKKLKQKGIEIAKKRAENIKKTAKKAVKLGATAGLAAPRIAMLGLIKLNVHGFATKLNDAIKINSAKVEKTWNLLGGNYNELKKIVSNNAGKKPILGDENEPIKRTDLQEGIGVAVAAALASAAPIIIAVVKMLKEVLPPSKQQGLENVNETTNAAMDEMDERMRKTGASEEEIEKSYTELPNQENSGGTSQEKASDTEGDKTTNTNNKKDNMLPLLGLVALGALAMKKKKKKRN